MLHMKCRSSILRSHFCSFSLMVWKIAWAYINQVLFPCRQIRQVFACTSYFFRGGNGFTEFILFFFFLWSHQYALWTLRALYPSWMKREGARGTKKKKILKHHRLRLQCWSCWIWPEEHMVGCIYAQNQNWSRHLFDWRLTQQIMGRPKPEHPICTVCY